MHYLPLFLFVACMPPLGAQTVDQKDWALAQAVRRSFVLLDENGKEGKGTGPRADLFPFGALVAVMPAQGGTFESTTCTATHLGKGLVITATHCLALDRQGTKRFVAFYDKNGEKVVAPVQGLEFTGDIVFDIAVLSIPESASAHWDAAGGGIRSMGRVPTSKTREPHEGVILWSYTPLENFPELKSQYPNQTGMVFRPNRCLASRVKPSLEAFPKGKRPRRRVRPIFRLHLNGKIPVKDHVFLDRCKYPILVGNSGSLITLFSNFSQKIAITQAVVAEKDRVWQRLTEVGLDQKGIDFYLRAVDNSYEKVSLDESVFFIGAGILLSALDQKSPGLIPPR